MTKLIPHADRVIVKLEKYKVSDTIWYPETQQSLCPNIGTIRFLGENGRKAGLNVGDKVCVEMFTGQMNVEIDGEELKMLKLEHILGVLESVEV